MSMRQANLAKPDSMPERLQTGLAVCFDAAFRGKRSPARDPDPDLRQVLGPGGSEKRRDHEGSRGPGRTGGGGSA